MTIGAVLEPIVVVTLLFGGAWINRARKPVVSGPVQCNSSIHEKSATALKDIPYEDEATAQLPSRNGSLSPSLLPSQEKRWRHRELRFLAFKKTIETPNTAVFRNRFLSRVLRHLPFLVEAWYWALIYWVYQLGRAFSALAIVDGTVNMARRHALQVIDAEKRLHIFWEVPIQQFFMSFPTVMQYINWLYSFIHIPGTIAFLVWLYYHTITSNRLNARQPHSESLQGSLSGPVLYEARRRTMAVCNLMAFVIFTLWPCMPPRLLSDEAVPGDVGELARSFGFVDTVHGPKGAVSVWTTNKFCNQWAAMPSLHFGYSLLVGVTIMTIPLARQHRRSNPVRLPLFNQSHPDLAPWFRLPSTRRLICIALGFLYPFSILVAIVSTANHFILDAVAGGFICFVGWKTNSVLLNLLPLEDYLLWYLRIHKPSVERMELSETPLPEDGESPYVS